MAAAAIDTLRYAEKLKDGGVERSTANEMARALNDELSDHVPTKTDLEPRFASIEATFQSIDARFEAIDARFEAIDARFEAIDARFEALEARIDALDVKFEARFEALEAKFDSLAASLKVTQAMMILGFGLLGTLGVFQLTRDSSAAAAPVTIEQPAAIDAMPVEATP